MKSLILAALMSLAAQAHAAPGDITCMTNLFTANTKVHLNMAYKTFVMSREVQPKPPRLLAHGQINAKKLSNDEMLVYLIETNTYTTDPIVTGTILVRLSGPNGDRRSDFNYKTQGEPNKLNVKCWVNP